MSKILSITEGSFKSDDYPEYDGFIITTETQVLKLGIENNQSCCENWGYFMSQDDFSEFINADLIDVTVVDTELNTEKLTEEIYDREEAHCMFVNINTSVGLLQFAAYNEHNGYYGHDAVVISENIQGEISRISETL